MAKTEKIKTKKTIIKKIVKKTVIKKKIVKKQKPKNIDFGVQNDNVVVLRYTVSSKFPVERHIFLKKQDDNDKGLTVSNVPAFISDNQVKTLLEHFVEEGKIVSAFVKRKENAGFRVMVVYFESEPWLLQLFSKIKKSKVICLEDFEIALPAVGLKKYAIEYNKQFKPVEQMREEIESSVAAYDDHVKERREEAKRVTEEVDEDGWTKITKGHKRAFAPRKNRIVKKKNK